MDNLKTPVWLVADSDKRSFLLNHVLRGFSQNVMELLKEPSLEECYELFKDCKSPVVIEVNGKVGPSLAALAACYNSFTAPVVFISEDMPKVPRVFTVIISPDIDLMQPKKEAESDKSAKNQQAK